MSNNLPYISALVAIVVIVVVVLGLNNGITGAPTMGEYRGVSSVCDETDPAQDEFTLGVVTIKERDGLREYPDKCFDNILVQYFCIDTVHFEGVGRYCKNGCEDGVCVK